MKVIPKNIKVLLIAYHYTDKAIQPGNLGSKLKTYYENNARGKMFLDLTSVAYKVPFTSKQVDAAHEYVKKIMPKGFFVNVHFCNPKISRTGQGNVMTYASATNVIHEFGHALGLGHANSKLSGSLVHSRDPFDQMTIFGPYASTNSVHRYLKDWFLEGELVEYVSSKPNYTIGMLKNFNDRKSAKVILYKRPRDSKVNKFLVSYGSKFDKKTKKNVKYVALHTIYGKESSVLIGMYKVVKDKVYTNAEAGMSIRINDFTENLVELTINWS